tara:strand:+ start:315 stop:503 length:189 start_codon:yes stop_codon:yes gene_type:complete
MIKFKNQVDADKNQAGWSVIILWLFAVTLSYNIIKGDHITLGLSVGPIEIALCLSIWRKLLP